MRLLLLTLLIFNINSYATIIEYKIKKGDSITQICNIFNTTYKELKEINDEKKIVRLWENDRIKIRLKDYTIQEYTIKKGDTIFDIINKYNADLNILYAINDINVLNKFWAGDKIILPIKMGVDNVQEKTKNTKAIKHYVKKGETIYSIARKYDINPEYLIRKYSDKIYEGQIIEIEKSNISEPILKFKKQNLNFPYPIQTYVSTSKQEIYSPIEGKIIGIRTLKGFGKAIFIENKNITTILTSKGLKTEKNIGEYINKGEIIGSIDKNYTLSLILVDDSEMISVKEFIDERS